MDYLEKETAKQTALLEKQEIRLTRIERIILLGLGALGLIQVAIKVVGVI